jgi:pilus assembly protein CpaB
MKKSTLKLVAIAAVMSISITFVVITLTKPADVDSTISLPDISQGKMSNPIISLVDLAPYSSAIDRAMIDKIEYPLDLLPRHASMEFDDVINKLPSAPIYAGEIILLTRLVEKNEYKESLRQLIPAGYRAITITIDSLSGVSGFISQGDIIDLIAVYNKSVNTTSSGRPRNTKEAKLRLQNIKVLIVGSKYNPVTSENQGKSIQGSDKNKTITLAVHPKEALQIHHIVQRASGASFRILLKNCEDRQIVHTDGFNDFEMEDETLKLLRNQNGQTELESHSNEEEDTFTTVQYNVERWAGTKQMQAETFTETKKIN